MWCWRRMEKFSWTDRVRKKKYYTESRRRGIHTIKRRKANWFGHILRRRCLLQHVIEGKLEGSVWMMGRWGRRRKQLLNDLKEKRSYWRLKEEALDCIIWRTRFGRGYGPVVRQITGWINLSWGFPQSLRTNTVRIAHVCNDHKQWEPLG